MQLLLAPTLLGHLPVPVTPVLWAMGRFVKVSILHIFVCKSRPLIYSSPSGSVAGLLKTGMSTSRYLIAFARFFFFLRWLLTLQIGGVLCVGMWGCVEVVERALKQIHSSVSDNSFSRLGLACMTLAHTFAEHACWQDMGKKD